MGLHLAGPGQSGEGHATQCHMECGVHDKVMDLAFCVVLGRMPFTTLSWACQVKVQSIKDQWMRLFHSPLYSGCRFLHLLGRGDYPTTLQPTYLNRGTWLKDLDTPQLCARACHTLLDHTPLGSYRLRFNMAKLFEEARCSCGPALQCHAHVLMGCPQFIRTYEGHPRY